MLKMMGEVWGVQFCAGNRESVLGAVCAGNKLTRFSSPEVPSTTSTYSMVVLQSGQDCLTSSQLSRHR